MNPNVWRGNKSFFERKAERVAARGLPSDHQKPNAAPKAASIPIIAKPKYAAGGLVSATYMATFNAQLQADLAKIWSQYPFAIMAQTLTTPDPQFSGKEFAIGQARGARSFKVDSLGRLTGIHYPQVWTPDENQSQCLSEFGVHKEGDFAEKCRCGFYGYYDGSNDFHDENLVSGVIDGYGDAVLGTRGFRVTKARIVALTIADDASGPLARLVRRNYSAIPFFDSFTRMVSEFPPDYELDAKTIPSPETDPDFWTRTI